MKKSKFLFIIALIAIAFLPLQVSAAVKPAELSTYLDEISKKRGETITEQDLEDYLSAFYDESISDYDSVDELRDYLGEVINKDFSNLSGLYEEYDLTYEELVALLSEYGESLSDYIFIDDLEFSIIFYTDEDIDSAFADLEAVMLDIISEYGLTDKEIERLLAHFESISDIFLDESVLNRLENLEARLNKLPDFDNLTQITDAQANELVAVFNEFLDIFQLKASYVLITKDGVEKAVSLNEVIKMTDLDGAKLKINIYDLNGKFLADIIITGDMVGSNAIKSAGGKAESVASVTKTEKPAKKVTKKSSTAPAKKATQKAQTVKGAKLPKTASPYGMNMLLGLGALAAGVAVYTRSRKVA